MKRVEWGFQIGLFIALIYVGSGAYTQWKIDALAQMPIPPGSHSPQTFQDQTISKMLQAITGSAKYITTLRLTRQIGRRKTNAIAFGKKLFRHRPGDIAD
ncbi:MAG: hypothetical protein F6J97_20095 [Leptolyngbya sp. SIO4C1]|nr:hypothetical protein [Leptolyngbya sp. SIO4C1]